MSKHAIPENVNCSTGLLKPKDSKSVRFVFELARAMNPCVCYYLPTQQASFGG